MGEGSHASSLDPCMGQKSADLLVRWHRCELAGLADEPHRKVKNARRVQVADPEAQHSHITDAAALHGCEVSS